MLILTNDYYNVPNLYRFMPKSIFNALEQSFLNGDEYTLVSETDFMTFTHAIILTNGIESN